MPDGVTIEDGGKNVRVRIFANHRASAISAYEWSDDNPPLGYILLFSQIRRREKGGKARFLDLHFRHTGNREWPPMTGYKDWLDTTEEERRIAREREVEGSDLDWVEDNSEGAERSEERGKNG